MFTAKFGRYVTPGDSIACDVDGFRCVATVQHDEDTGEPWKEHDGHGPVSDWTRDSPAAGQVVLCADRSSRRYYDLRKATDYALREGWGVPGGRQKGETKKKYAARAAQHDFAVLKAWCEDEWQWSGVVVTIYRDGVELGDASLWGIERNYPGADNSYLAEVANELLSEALDSARTKLAKLCAGVCQ